MIFSHFSVQEYLVSGRSEAFSSWSQSAHRYIGKCCLSSLLQLKDPVLTGGSAEENQVLNYAAEHWFTHLSQVEARADESSLLDHTYALFDRNARFYCNWLRIYEPKEHDWFQFGLSSDKSPPPLYYACHLGFLDVARRLIEAGADANEAFASYGTPLFEASHNGKQQVVQLLLDHGADVNAHDPEAGTPIEAAAVAGHEEIVQLLLRHGADVNSPGSWMFGSTLQATLKYCETEAIASNIATMLLDRPWG